MNLNELKSGFFLKRSQIVVMDDDGMLKHSCNTLFDLSQKEKSLFNEEPFLESIQDLVIGLKVGQEIGYPCINQLFSQEKKFYDLSFKREAIENEDRIVWIITDLTDHYTNLLPIQQERNELDISGEFHEMHRKALAAEKKLLQYKNSELKRIEKFKEQFFAQVNHEMRTPLNGITGLANLLNTADNKLKKKYVISLIDCSNHLASIVNDMLDLSKAEAGKLLVSEKSFNLKSLVQGILNSFTHLINPKSISLKLEIDKDIPHNLIGDSKKLSQILYNFLSNSIKFTKSGSVNLKVALVKQSEKKAHLNFTINDSGIGISPTDIKKLFEPYFQVESANSSSGLKGTGLGLGISKKLIELQKGELQIESELGKGTTISFQIPYKQSNSAQSETKGAPVKSHFKVIRKILVAEDDEVNQLVLKDLLNQHGIATTIVSRGQELLKKLKGYEFDLILLDLNLPDFYGKEIVEIIRNEFSAPKRQIPIVIISGQMPDKALFGKTVEDLLLKPIDPEILVNTIKTIDVKQSKKLKINLKYLQKITQSDSLLMNELITTFIRKVPLNVKLMRDHQKNKNWDSLRMIVHKSIPSFQYVGIKEVSLILDNFESDLKAGKNKKSYSSIISKIERCTSVIVNDLVDVRKTL